MSGSVRPHRRGVRSDHPTGTLQRESLSSTNQPVCAQTDECKTYKIIMNKLDELNRLFAARARPPNPAPPAPPAPRRPAPDSSGSVSVYDKLVATEPIGAECTRELHVANNVVAVILLFLLYFF